MKHCLVLIFVAWILVLRFSLADMEEGSLTEPRMIISIMKRCGFRWKENVSNTLKEDGHVRKIFKRGRYAEKKYRDIPEVIMEDKTHPTEFAKPLDWLLALNRFWSILKKTNQGKLRSKQLNNQKELTRCNKCKNKTLVGYFERESGRTGKITM